VGKGRVVVVRSSVSLQYLHFAASREAMMCFRSTDTGRGRWDEVCEHIP
jgi:hypothetical protein